jgi:hypothetical protein
MPRTMIWQDVPADSLVRYGDSLYLKDRVNPTHPLLLLTAHRRFAHEFSLSTARGGGLDRTLEDVVNWVRRLRPQITHCEYQGHGSFHGFNEVEVIATFGQPVDEALGREIDRRAQQYLNVARATTGLVYIGSDPLLRRSTYAAADGSEVVMRSVDGGYGVRILGSLDDLLATRTLDSLLAEQDGLRSAFKDWVADQYLVDRGERDRINQCCNDSAWGVDMQEFEDRPAYYLCEKEQCREEYPTCEEEGCDRLWMYRLSAYDADGDEIRICGPCAREKFLHCSSCSMYYPYGSGCFGDHRDESAKCCESPMKEFSIGLADGGRLANDERTTVTLEATIPFDTLLSVKRVLRDHWLDAGEGVADTPEYQMYVKGISAVDAEAVNPVWMDSDRRTYPKRLAKYIWDEAKVKVPKEVVAQIGDAVRDSTIAAEFEVEITRELDQSAAAFAHPDSCWFDGSYNYSRCTLKSHGGFGLRSFYGDRVTGRAWVFPVKVSRRVVRPTFDEPDGYFVFNAYGDLEERKGVRALSALTGMGKTVRLDTHNMKMYVNGCAGHLILPDNWSKAVPNSFSDLYPHERTPEIPSAPVAVTVEPATVEPTPEPVTVDDLRDLF